MKRGWAFEAHHCPSTPNVNGQTKLQIYTEPQADINILWCALNGKYSSSERRIPEGASPLCARVVSGNISKYQLVASAKSWKNLKEKIKSVTKKTSPMSFEERIIKLREIQQGWVNYFRMASLTGKLKDLDSWVRNRLRYCIWHDWKKPNRKKKNLIRLGIAKGQAYAWSRTRMGGWAVAQSPILVTTITLKRLAKRGYESMLDYYLKVSPSVNEPPYMVLSTRVRKYRRSPVRTVV